MSFRDMLNRPLPSKLMMEDVDDITPEDIDDVDTPDTDPVEGEVTLNPEEEEEADRAIELAATPVLLKEVLSDKEVKEFVEDNDFNVACNEGFMTESFADEVGADSMFMEGKGYYNKMVIRLDKKARFAQLFEISVLGCAKAKNDPDFIKLQKLQKARRALKKKLRMKYKGQALKRAKFYLQRLKSSRSGIMRKVADSVSHK